MATIRNTTSFIRGCVMVHNFIQLYLYSVHLYTVPLILPSSLPPSLPLTSPSPQCHQCMVTLQEHLTNESSRVLLELNELCTLIIRRCPSNDLHYFTMGLNVICAMCGQLHSIEKQW